MPYGNPQWQESILGIDLASPLRFPSVPWGKWYINNYNIQ